MKDEISRGIEAYIQDHILQQPNRKIDPCEPLLSSGLIDSFNLMDLALFVEDQFGVLIDNTELNADTFDTLDQLAELIVSHKA